MSAVARVPAFDAYVVGAPRDVEAFLPAGLRDRVYRPQGWLSPALLVDGVVAGVWRHEVSGGRLSVEVEPFTELAAEAAVTVADEADRLGHFLGFEADVEWR